VHTIERGSGRRRRRAHSAAFKAEAVAACRQPGMSIAAAAMARAINANLLRRWVVEAERAEGVGGPKALPPPKGGVHRFAGASEAGRKHTGSGRSASRSFDGERAMAELGDAQVRNLAA
jgi:transposase-like protein